MPELTESEIAELAKRLHPTPRMQHPSNNQATGPSYASPSRVIRSAIYF